MNYVPSRSSSSSSSLSQDLLRRSKSGAVPSLDLGQGTETLDIRGNLGIGLGDTVRGDMINMSLGKAANVHNGKTIGNGGLVATTKERAAVLVDHVRKISEPLGKFV